MKNSAEIQVYPSSSLVKCKIYFSPLQDKTFQTFVTKTVEILEEQRDCAIRHNTLVDFINKPEGN